MILFLQIAIFTIDYWFSNRKTGLGSIVFVLYVSICYSHSLFLRSRGCSGHFTPHYISMLWYKNTNYFWDFQQLICMGKISPIFWQIIRFFHYAGCYWNNNGVVIYLTANSRIITDLPNLLSDSGLPATPSRAQSGLCVHGAGAPPLPARQIPGRKKLRNFFTGTLAVEKTDNFLAVNKFYAAKHWEIKADK